MESPDATFEPVIKKHTWPGYLLALYALAAGALTLQTLAIYPFGWANFSRPLLACLGILGGVLLLMGDSWWKGVLLLWLGAQVPVLIMDPSGELTRQTGGLNLIFSGVTIPTTWNNLVVAQSGLGINCAALGLFCLTLVILGRGWFPSPPEARWLAWSAEAIRFLILGLVLGAVTLVALRWGGPSFSKDVVMVLDSPPPGAEVYAGEKNLGKTPLVITGEKLREWGLARSGVPETCRLASAAVDNGFLLVGSNSKGLPLSFKPPQWCFDLFQTMRTPTGPRAVPLVDAPNTGSGSNYHKILLGHKSQPGFVLTELAMTPASCGPGQPVEFALQVRRNPPDPRIARPLPQARGEQARLRVTFWLGNNTSNYKDVDLPKGLAELGPGQEAKHVLQLPAPDKPGLYTVQYTYLLLTSTNSPRAVKQSDLPHAFAFGYLEVR